MAVDENNKVVIPKQYNPENGTLPAFREDFDVSRDQRMADHLRDHNHTVGQVDDEGEALNNGRRRLSHRSPEQSLIAKEKKHKDRSLLRMALKQWLDRLEALYEEIAAIDQRLSEIDIEMRELEHLHELAEQRVLDPKNPAHAKLLKKYRITQDDLTSGRLSFILAGNLGNRVEEQTELQKRKASLQEQANDAIEEAQANELITGVEADQFRQRLESSDAGVSSQIRITQDVPEELRHIAVNHYGEAFEGDTPMEELAFTENPRSTQSVAATLTGRASYKKGVQSHGQEISIKQQFTKSTNPVQDDSTPQGAATTKICLGPLNT